jgi:hypothetical protein
MTLRRQQAVINADLIARRAKLVPGTDEYSVVDQAVKLGERISDHLYDLERNYEPVPAV